MKWIEMDEIAGNLLIKYKSEWDDNFVLWRVSPKVLRKLIVMGIEHSFAELETLTEKYPNDMDLGKEIRSRYGRDS